LYPFAFSEVKDAFLQRRKGNFFGDALEEYAPGSFFPESHPPENLQPEIHFPGISPSGNPPLKKIPEIGKIAYVYLQPIA